VCADGVKNPINPAWLYIAARISGASETTGAPSQIQINDRSVWEKSIAF
jgi:hypothetical protein